MKEMKRDVTLLQLEPGKVRLDVNNYTPVLTVKRRQENSSSRTPTRL